MIEIFYRKPRATFCRVRFSHAKTIGLDHVRTPGGMVTDNSQLVLRADRMLLFSRKVPPVACSLAAVVSPVYTPPHDKQAVLLIGTKVVPFHPPYMPNQNGPNWWNGSPSQRASVTPLLKVLLPAWSSEVTVRKHSK